MRRTISRRLFAGFLAIFLFLCGQTVSAAADTTSDTAKMIQLVAAEGSVTVTDSSKNTVSQDENGPTRLYSGYHIITGKDSYAWFSLDESKTVKLDAYSEVEIRSRRRKLEILLISGALYCNVTAPVPRDQIYEIRTSDTITGIRGTTVGVDIGRTEEGKDTVTLFKGMVDVLLGNRSLWHSFLVHLNAGQSVSFDRASDDGSSTPSALSEISSFFFEALEEDGFDVPWIKKAVEEDHDTNNTGASKEGNISNLFLNGSSSTTGNADSGSIDPDEDETQDQDPDSEQNQQDSLFAVTWLDEDGTVLEKDENVPFGSKPSYDGATPTKEPTAQFTYSFAGWDKEIASVTGEATYTATYSETVNKYAITWLDGNGKTLKTEELAYGATPVYSGDTPSKDATEDTVYTFNEKWLPEIADVIEDTSYAAQFDSAPRKYTVTWLDGNGNTLKREELAYGATPAYSGDTPSKDATEDTVYTFNEKWLPEIVDVIEDVSYAAQFDSAPRKYTVTWIDGNGKTLKTEELAYGATPSYEGDEPAKDPTADTVFTFNEEWLPEIVDVIEDASYAAQFDSAPRKYAITWIDGNGKTLKTEELTYGATPAYDGVTPPMDSLDESFAYSLSWTPEITDVTDDAKYEAVYSKIGCSLSNDDNGTVLHIGLYNENENEGNGNYSVLIPAGEYNEAGLLEYILNSGDGSYIEKITELQIVFDEIISPLSMDYWFSSLPENTTFENLDYLDTSHVTSMSRLFAFSGMTELDLRSFDTSHVTNMEDMFSSCTQLQSIHGLSSFDTSSVTYMSEMFCDCYNLGPTLDLSSFDTSNVVSVSLMFGNCSSLQTIYAGDLFDISQAEDGEEMFSGCRSLSGGAGTSYDSTKGASDASYANIDTEDDPGYFTRKPEP